VPILAGTVADLDVDNPAVAAVIDRHLVESGLRVVGVDVHWLR